jgi:hypothetical protein
MPISLCPSSSSFSGAITRPAANGLIRLAIEAGISPGYGVQLELWMADEMGVEVEDVHELPMKYYREIRERLEQLAGGA